MWRQVVQGLSFSRQQFVKRSTRQSIITTFAKMQSTAFLFPGQGSQEKGMTKDALSIPAVAEMYEVAQDVLGYDLKQIVMEDGEKVNMTSYCQPALLIAGLAAVEKLRETDPTVIDSVKATAGLSLGEYTALTFSGAISLRDALRLTKLRGEAMQAASDAEAGVMLSIVGVDDDEIVEAVNTARDATGQVVTIANYLAPQIRVVSGTPAAVDLVEEALTPKAIKVQRLNVSGAFHSALMAPACEKLAEALQAVDIQMPKMDVYANTTGKKYTSAIEIRDELLKQVAQPVRWEQLLKEMIGAGCTQLYELGPKRQIKSMLRKVDPKVFRAAKNVTV
eukprot:m.359742 g.359742  ORF g.359742 m.359742 type:complete len:335 (+) comp18701_c0_seq1:438-1442(+)